MGLESDKVKPLGWYEKLGTCPFDGNGVSGDRLGKLPVTAWGRERFLANS